jgi:hypothetical protein
MTERISRRQEHTAISDTTYHLHKLSARWSVIKWN